MGNIVPRGTGQIEIIYGGLTSPFQGIDATKSSGVYLAPNSLCASSNLAVQDGYLSSIFINYRSTLNAPVTLTSSYYYTVGDVSIFKNVTPGVPTINTELSVAFIVSSTNVGLTLYEYRNGLVNPLTATIVLGTYQNAVATGPLVHKTINGSVYITGPGLGAIYVYTPSYASASTLNLLTNYVGGAVLNELNGRLICLCCDSFNGTSNITYSPFQMSWSAAAGQYNIWNPLVSGLVTGAGYNNLPDVEDRITGFIAVGPTGYIIRKQGITEVSPLNSGIQPYDFNHMWASGKGIGSIYPYTVCQYGSLGAFVSDTGVYTIGYGGINMIHGFYWNQLSEQISDYTTAATAEGLPLLQVISNIWGTLCPVYVDGDSYIAFILSCPVVTNTAAITLAIGNVETKDWSTITSGVVASYPATSAPPVIGMSSAAFYGTGIDNTIPIISLASLYQGVISFINFTIDDYIIQSTGNPLPTNPVVSFQLPSEEVQMWKDITVNSIVIYLKVDVTGFQSGQDLLVQPSLDSLTQSDVLYTSVSIPVNLGINGIYRFDPATSGLCDKYPQLSFTFTCPLNIAKLAIRIYKISMFCSYDTAQVP